VRPPSSRRICSRTLSTRSNLDFPHLIGSEQTGWMQSLRAAPVSTWLLGPPRYIAGAGSDFSHLTPGYRYAKSRTWRTRQCEEARETSETGGSRSAIAGTGPVRCRSNGESRANQSLAWFAFNRLYSANEITTISTRLCSETSVDSSTLISLFTVGTSRSTITPFQNSLESFGLSTSRAYTRMEARCSCQAAMISVDVQTMPKF